MISYIIIYHTRAAIYRSISDKRYKKVRYAMKPSLIKVNTG